MSILHLSAFNFTKSLPARRCNLTVGLSSNNHFHLVNIPSARVKSMTTIKNSDDQTNVVRRSGGYAPSIWSYDYIQSFKSDYVGDSFAKRLNKLKQDVKMMLDPKVMMQYPLLHQLELIDTLQRLGLSYHFEDDIWKLLNNIYSNKDYKQKQESHLHVVALEFKLLRQHGFRIPQDVFSRFMDEGKFKSCICDDCEGMLSLYEAAHLLLEEENDLHTEAIKFTTTYLKEYSLKDNNKDEYLWILVNHALDLPLHWRMIRLETRWFIDAYQRKNDMNPILLEFAKLDFNIVQATHQEDLKYASRWWRDVGLAEKLEFARDRLMENFLWSVGIAFEPQHGNFRRIQTEVNALITTIDDVYDVYGTIDELGLFTKAVEKWDGLAMEELPNYMKICFLALHNSVNKAAYETLIKTGVEVVHYLKKMWADLCKSYLVEAKWYYSGHNPSFQEYIENSLISIAAPVILAHAYCSITYPISKEALSCLEKYPNVIRWSSMILRLADDLGTSPDEMKRDVPKSIQCYMKETGASEEEAREHIRGLISETWMKMNKEVNGIGNQYPFISNTFVRTAMNLGRMAQCIYQNGDGHGIEDGETKGRVLSLFVDPIM